MEVLDTCLAPSWVFHWVIGSGRTGWCRKELERPEVHHVSQLPRVLRSMVRSKTKWKIQAKIRAHALDPTNEGTTHRQTRL